MKYTLLAILALTSFNSFAFINEVECELVSSDQNILLEVEQAFPRTSVFRQATLTVTANGTQNEFNYTVTARRTMGFNQIQYMGAGLRLEVDHWPDQIPRWGRTYRGTMTSSDYNNQTVSNLQCTFPNAQF